ncbi:MAG: glycerophosphodiester phosphodiesterase [Promethearchaeota archaeon]|jgi:glycerophosphoryl diester phosphodiesterase
MRPYIFGHRGASGYEIENTIPAFKKAVSMGAGIEADVRFTKDNQLICFHDPFFKGGTKLYFVNRLSLDQIRALKFEDKRRIPLVKDVFYTFKDISENLRYSFDISDKNAGIQLINIAKNAQILENIEITDRGLITLSLLRKYNKPANLVYNLGENIKKITDKTLNLKKIKKINIQAINLRYKRNIEDLFQGIKSFGLKCYVWGVNTQVNMKKVVKLKYKDETVDAIYTDYPDKLLNLIMEHFK